METIKEILQKYEFNANQNEINLGISNGWLSKKIHLLRSLRNYKLEGSEKEKELNRCHTEHSFIISDNIDKFIVIYSSDSSD
jgi:hypothetical protein